MRIRPCSVGADRERRESEWRRFAGCWDEGTVDEDLEVVVGRVKVCRLTEMGEVFSVGIPSYYTNTR